MTQPNPAGALALPSPNPDRPMVLRMITNGILPPDLPPNVPVPASASIALWAVDVQHPLMESLTVRRMIDQGNGVDVYSTSADGRVFIRHFVPIAQIRITEELMSAQLFVEEMTAAETDTDDGDDPEDDEPEPEPEPLPANGQSTS